MANFATLLQTIAGNIYTNGRNEIDAADLKSVLNAMVEGLGQAGYIFKGVAQPSTNPGTPDTNVFYLAGVGTFTNFGGTTVNKGHIGVFAYNGSWSYQVLTTGAWFDSEVYPSEDALEITFYDSDDSDGVTIKINADVSELGNSKLEAISAWWAAQKERRINVIGGYDIEFDQPLTTSPQSLGLFKYIEPGQVIASFTNATQLVFQDIDGGTVTINATDLPYKATKMLTDVKSPSGTISNAKIRVNGVINGLTDELDVKANHGYDSAPKTLKAVDEAKVDKTSIVGETGQGEMSVMHQKAVTDELALKVDKVISATDGNFAGLDSLGNLTDSGKKAADFEPADETILKEVDIANNLSETVAGKVLDATQGKLLNDELALKIDKTSVKQTTGDSTTVVMSQKAVTDELALKIDKTSVKQTTGDLTTFVMSQKAVTDELALKADQADLAQLEQEQIQGGVYDVSAHNDGAVFESLQALLSSSNLSTLIPTNVRKGGMSIKFIQSSDNKYIQARCMAQNFTTDITQWQDVDNEPTAGSDNLVKSGGVASKIFSDFIIKYPLYSTLQVYVGMVDVNTWSLGPHYRFKVIPVTELAGVGLINVQSGTNTTNIAFLKSFDYSQITQGAAVPFCQGTSKIAVPNTVTTYKIPSDCNYLYLQEKGYGDTQYTTPITLIINGYNYLGGVYDNIVNIGKIKIIAHESSTAALGTLNTTTGEIINQLDRAYTFIENRPNKTAYLNIKSTGSVVKINSIFKKVGDSYVYYAAGDYNNFLYADSTCEGFYVIFKGYADFTEHLTDINISCDWYESTEEAVERIDEKLKSKANKTDIDNIDLSAIKVLEIKENEKRAYLTDRFDGMDGDIALLDSVKRGTTQDLVVLNLTSTSNKKLLLNLHKTSGEGMAAFNNVYLPNAADDFSDVKVKDIDGNILPYHIISRLDVDFSQPIGFPDTPIIANSRGELFAGDTSRGLVHSTDNGSTWALMSQFSSLFNTQAYAVYVDDEDTLFFSSPSKLYKSAYPYETASMVLDLTDATEYNTETGQSLSQMTGCYIFPNHFVKYGNAYYCAGYQNEDWIRIYKSVDGGSTWTLNFSYIDTENPQAFQHVHNLYLDTFTNTMYAGCDRAGHVFKSTDGTTWTDIKTSDWKNSTDYGVIYAGSGFRLLGGETSIKGGRSLQRTTNDVSLTSVLANGHGCYMATKYGNYIFVGVVSAEAYKSSGIYASKDNGQTWKLVYLTPRINAGGASDGFRYLYPVKIGGNDVVFCGCQGYNNNLIIRSGKFSQIMVDVPAGLDKVIVQSGFLKGNVKGIYNDVSESNLLVDLPFNENCDFIVERKKDLLFNGSYSWQNIGRSIGDVVPRITRTIDQNSLLIKTGMEGFNVGKINLSNGFHVGFWANLKADCKWTLLSIGNYSLTINGYQLRVNDSYTKIISIGYPLTLATLDRYDICIDTSGNILAFKNGESISNSVNASDLLINAEATVCVPVSMSDMVPIQHLTISSNQITQSDALKYYYAGIDDNH